MIRLWLVAWCGAALLPAQVASHANQNYYSEKGRQGLIRSLSRPGRDAQQKPLELVAAMGLASGAAVADVGTGTGYMLPFLSAAVGPTGKVLAEDIFDDFLDAAREYAQRRSLTNVTFIKGTETDPRLPGGSVDTVLLLDTYHHLDYPEKMLAAIRAALRPGGRLVVVEQYQRLYAVPSRGAKSHVRVDKAGVIAELEAAGFRKLSEREHVKDSQYMLILESK